MLKRRNLFIGFKSAKAIPVREPLVRDLLIQTTLNPDVSAIDYQANVFSDDRVVAVDGILVDRCDGSYAVDIVDARPAADQAAVALMQVALQRNCRGIIETSAADIRAEPRLSSAREVWGHRAMHVHPDDRAQIVGTLESEGPLELVRFDELVDTQRDTRAVIYSLACEGTVELDLRAGLGARAMVRAGRFAYSAPLRVAYGA